MSQLRFYICQSWSFYMILGHFSSFLDRFSSFLTLVSTKINQVSQKSVRLIWKIEV